MGLVTKEQQQGNLICVTLRKNLVTSLSMDIQVVSSFSVINSTTIDISVY